MYIVIRKQTIARGITIIEIDGFLRRFNEILTAVQNLTTYSAVLE